MGIEFIEQPPKKVGDIKLDGTLERTSIGYSAEFGFDPMWIQIGEQDTSAVFTNILEHSSPKDTIDFEILRDMLYDVAEDLHNGRQKSYKRGVDLYIAQMTEIGKQGQS